MGAFGLWGHALPCGQGEVQSPRFGSHGEVLTLDFAGASFAIKLPVVHVAGRSERLDGNLAACWRMGLGIRCWVNSNWRAGASHAGGRDAQFWRTTRLPSVARDGRGTLSSLMLLAGVHTPGTVCLASGVDFCQRPRQLADTGSPSQS